MVGRKGKEGRRGGRRQIKEKMRRGEMISAEGGREGGRGSIPYFTIQDKL